MPLHDGRLGVSIETSNWCVVEGTGRLRSINGMNVFGEQVAQSTEFFCTRLFSALITECCKVFEVRTYENKREKMLFHENRMFEKFLINESSVRYVIRNTKWKAYEIQR